MTRTKQKVIVTMVGGVVLLFFLLGMNYLRFGKLITNPYYAVALFFLIHLFPLFGFVLQWFAEKYSISGKIIITITAIFLLPLIALFVWHGLLPGENFAPNGVACGGGTFVRFCYSDAGIHNNERTLEFYLYAIRAVAELLMAQLIYIFLKRHMSQESVARRVGYGAAILIVLNIVLAGCYWLVMNFLYLIYS